MKPTPQSLHGTGAVGTGSGRKPWICRAGEGFWLENRVGKESGTDAKEKGFGGKGWDEAEIGKGGREEPWDPRMREWFGFPAPPVPSGKEDFIKRWESEDRETSESNSPQTGHLRRVWELGPTNPARTAQENGGKGLAPSGCAQGMSRGRGRGCWSRAVGIPIPGGFNPGGCDLWGRGAVVPGNSRPRSQRAFPTFIIP